MCQQHGDNRFLICGHDDVHDETQDLFVGLFVCVSGEVIGEDGDEVSKDGIGLYDYWTLGVIFEVVADEDEDAEGKDLRFFLCRCGDFDKMFKDAVYVVVVDENLGQAFSESVETFQCVLPYDLLFVLD